METILGIVVVMCFSSMSLACSPEGYVEVHMDEMAFKAPIVAYGRVLKRHTSVYESTAYDAEFLVKCTYKGGPLPQFINITGGGYMSGLCGERNFTVGMDYIAFLTRDGLKYSQMYDETMEATSHMQELLSYCGMHMAYPVEAPVEHEACVDVSTDVSNCHQFQPLSPPILPFRPPPPVFQGEGNPNVGLLDAGSGDDVSSSTTGLISSSVSTLSMAVNVMTNTANYVSQSDMSTLENGSTTTSFPVISIALTSLLLLLK